MGKWRRVCPQKNLGQSRKYCCCLRYACQEENELSFGGYFRHEGWLLNDLWQ